MKKKRWYPVLIFAGILIIIAGIFVLREAVTQKNHSQIWIRSVLLAFWLFFTVNNYFLYKKEKRKGNNL